MLHLKRIDIDWQLRWFAEMTRNIADNPAVGQLIKDYFQGNRVNVSAEFA